MQATSRVPGRRLRGGRAAESVPSAWNTLVWVGTSGGREGRWERTCQAGLELQQGLAGVQRHARHAGSARSNFSARRSARSVPVCSAHHVCWESQRSGLLRATLKHRWSWLRPLPFTLSQGVPFPHLLPVLEHSGLLRHRSQFCCDRQVVCASCAEWQVVQGPAASAGASRGARARAAMAAAGKLERDALFKKLRGKQENKVCSPSARDIQGASRLCQSGLRRAVHAACRCRAGQAGRPGLRPAWWVCLRLQASIVCWLGCSCWLVLLGRGTPGVTECRASPAAGSVTTDRLGPGLL